MQKLKEAHEGRDWCALPGEPGEDPGLGASLGMLWAMPQCCFVSPLWGQGIKYLGTWIPRIGWPGFYPSFPLNSQVTGWSGLQAFSFQNFRSIYLTWHSKCESAMQTLKHLRKLYGKARSCRTLNGSQLLNQHVYRKPPNMPHRISSPQMSRIKLSWPPIFRLILKAEWSAWGIQDLWDQACCSGGDQ